jgi:hypothetical protein
LSGGNSVFPEDVATDAGSGGSIDLSGSYNSEDGTAAAGGNINLSCGGGSINLSGAGTFYGTTGGSIDGSATSDGGQGGSILFGDGGGSNPGGTLDMRAGYSGGAGSINVSKGGAAASIPPPTTMEKVWGVRLTSRPLTEAKLATSISPPPAAVRAEILGWEIMVLEMPAVLSTLRPAMWAAGVLSILPMAAAQSIRRRAAF